MRPSDDYPSVASICWPRPLLQAQLHPGRPSDVAPTRRAQQCVQQLSGAAPHAQPEELCGSRRWGRSEPAATIWHRFGGGIHRCAPAARQRPAPRPQVSHALGKLPACGRYPERWFASVCCADPADKQFERRNKHCCGWSSIAFPVKEAHPPVSQMGACVVGWRSGHLDIQGLETVSSHGLSCLIEAPVRRQSGLPGLKQVPVTKT